MQRNLIICFTISLLMSLEVAGQPLHKRLFDSYEKYQEKSLEHQRLSHADVQNILKKIESNSLFSTKKLGESVEGRSISLVSLGNGDIPVLLWSQMHGDEPTATLALADIFNFFAASGDEFDAYRSEILSKLTLHFIPMLNPDGSDRFQRRNALDIDLNRDAARLQCPESQILKNTRDELNAFFGFNLHDQSRFYSAGDRNENPAAISFLAPAFNYEKDINDVRKRAMQVIGLLDEMLQNYIPNKVAKYNDDFEPRAFGDNIQKWGTSTILVESGGYLGDPEKQFIRKLNYVLLLQSFQYIADQSYKKENTRKYDAIPFNDRSMHSLIVRNVYRSMNGKKYLVDIATVQNEAHEANRKAFRFRGRISEMGDLSVYHAYEELDGQQMDAVPGKVFPEVIEGEEAFYRLDFKHLLEEGYTAVRVSHWPHDKLFTDVPMNVITNLHSEPERIDLDGRANFVLKQEGKVKFAIVNGFLYDLSKKLDVGYANGEVY